MRTTQQMSITLPNEMAALVKARVASGEYASESEVIREGLRALLARDNAVEKWLQEQVVPAWNALQRGETDSLSGNDIRNRLKSEHKKATGES
ncbi:type II toxin-antitoxin system ParD family antitoxin [Pectobacterium sp. FL60-S17]|uniref:Antitoxin ParD n=1 Tax=Pectobacterium quasiaquaticum TaxID=2774015 RepID=A0A9Q2II75_9GAMM|nr:MULTISPECIES: type II toxin-antitoxin system ParD family antitoxin [Pectobacterium]PLY35949.1 type II toxin-antitoxin system ParD family antitoxin [Pectobacterium carotovorum]MBE5204611.1 type II toxin-antitoxin system ParD family antitoxin [Pectobacterium quasiaquaticum]MBE5212175.1 type II toxin-antitoxin system ParD family antitoxin [Pectobacterium quasiaquaticum]MBE5221020.1 type II toxin-antitoxin system ParD family antitoxin [Pectobacterium quasiaquaticum]MBN3065025.1 type II toxin-an